jgi:ABC exporter DevB family membrane fusion protein
MSNTLKRLRMPVAGVLVTGAVMVSLWAMTRQTFYPIEAEMKYGRRVIPPQGGDKASAAGPGFVVGNGLVEPYGEETRVASEGAGRVSVIHVTEGQHVEKGDVLLEFEHSLEDAAVAAASAAAEVAAAEFSRTTHGMRKQEVTAIASEAMAAQARKELAETELRRSEELARSGALSTAELDRAKKATMAERGAFFAASARASAARSGSRGEDIAIAQANVKAATARQSEAHAMLSRMLIRSPLAGEVLRVKYKVGEYYNPQSNQPLLYIGDTSRLRVRVDVDERDIAKVKPGAKAYAVASAFGDVKFPGTVALIARRMGRRTVRTDDPTDRVDVKILEVLVDIDDPSKLVPGLRVTGFIVAQ